MQQTTSKLLHEYWNRMRRGRLAPCRFEIEPAKIAPLLPETFIIECPGLLSYRFRLAGTRICEYFGRELRGEDFLRLWNGEDQVAVTRLVRAAAQDGTVGVVLFDGFTDDDRSVRLEMLVLPLVHAGNTVNRLMGSMAALETPYWLGTTPLVRQSVVSSKSQWPDGPPVISPPLGDEGGRRSPPTMPGEPRRRFRLVRGGLTEPGA